MKRLLLLSTVLGFLSFLMATPGGDHKVFWCHYPPGQWTGATSTSKVLILSIDSAASPGHLTHSPSLSGAPLPCVGADCAEGVTVGATDAERTANCPSVSGNACATFVNTGGCGTCPSADPRCGLCCA